jgi:hypothetical protein
MDVLLFASSFFDRAELGNQAEPAWCRRYARPLLKLGVAPD